MDQRQTWTTDEVLGWSRADTPKRPRGGTALITGAVAGTLGVTIAGMLATDSLCPEHRLWVQGLATAALVASIGAIIQAVRGQVSAAVLALVASCLGVGIGLIDAVHAPGRGRLLALGFAAGAVLSAFLAVRVWALRNWDRTLHDAHRPAVAGEGAHPVVTDHSVSATSTATVDPEADTVATADGSANATLR